MAAGAIARDPIPVKTQSARSYPERLHPKKYDAGACARPSRTECAPSLFGLTVLLSNAVSNVPAVMLLLLFSGHELAGMILGLASTFAGNLLIAGSIANIIVVDTAARGGVAIDWRRHARTGVPVTTATLALAGAVLWVQSLLD